MYLTGNLRFSPLSYFPRAGYHPKDDVDKDRWIEDSIPYMRATAYLHLFARGASSQGVVRQTDRVRSVLELPVRIHGSASHTLRSFVSSSEGPAEA
ncbi:hypothetical protein PIB30_037160 [Stylosanthes scabra]|uniref:Uncharacterized protein n=1 Tax=Stylosanthes scabra TaxID=79078 RepID=A0ABU6TDE1_9FABA|nr:hypothetical protein [Stylosanthes scabra]